MNNKVNFNFKKYKNDLHYLIERVISAYGCKESKKKHSCKNKEYEGT